MCARSEKRKINTNRICTEVYTVERTRRKIKQKQKKSVAENKSAHNIIWCDFKQ